jgi:hypothetical protein
VNRDPEQYSNLDDEEDRQAIADLINGLLVNDPDDSQTYPTIEALRLAAQPNYLGSPEVVSGVIQTVIEAAVAHSKGDISFNAVWGLIWDTSQEIATGEGYVRMPGWHTPQALGKALANTFGIRAEEIFADDLDYFVSEALILLFLKARDLLAAFTADPAAEWNPHALTQLNALHNWATTVFPGTDQIASPGVTLAHFQWQSASAHVAINEAN